MCYDKRYDGRQELRVEPQPPEPEPVPTPDIVEDITPVAVVDAPVEVPVPERELVRA